MKKWVVFLFVTLITNSFSQTNISPQFSELKGMEDQQVKTNLLTVEILDLRSLPSCNRQ